jgi:hypothetical protein
MFSLAKRVEQKTYCEARKKMLFEIVAVILLVPPAIIGYGVLFMLAARRLKPRKTEHLYAQILSRR